LAERQPGRNPCACFHGAPFTREDYFIANGAWRFDKRHRFAG
jgi:hypothetical protein